MRALIGLIAVGMVVGGCSRAPAYGSKDWLLGQAEGAVAKKLKDPASAVFTDLRIPRDGIVCGEVNGKNSYGAMSGAEPFIYIDIMADTGKDMMAKGATLASEDIGQPSDQGWQKLDFYADRYHRYGC